MQINSSSYKGKVKQDATLSQGVLRDAAVNFGATGIIGVITRTVRGPISQLYLRTIRGSNNCDSAVRTPLAAEHGAAAQAAGAARRSTLGFRPDLNTK